MCPLKVKAITSIINLKKHIMGKVINMNGREVKAIPLREAREYFMGRKGNKYMTYRSLKQRIYRKQIPQEALTKVNGVHWIDENYLKGNYQERIA